MRFAIILAIAIAPTTESSAPNEREEAVDRVSRRRSKAASYLVRISLRKGLSMRIRRSILLWAVVVLTAAHGRINGSDVVELRRRSFESCNAVRSGVASLKSERSLTTKRGSLTQRDSVRIAFDMDQGLLMYCVTDAEVDLSKMEDPKLEASRGRHAGRFGFPIGRVDGDGFTATRMDRNRIAIFSRSPETRFPDLRLVGFQNTREFDSFSTLEQLIPTWECNEAEGNVSPMTGLEAGMEGFVATIVISEIRKFQRAVIVDPARNYVPVRLFEKEIHTSEGSVREQLMANTIVEWKPIDDWYVPVEVDMRKYKHSAPFRGDDPSDIVHMVIEWQHVNSVVDPSLFDVSALDIPKGECKITDMRSGNSVTLQHPLVPTAEQLRKINEIEASAPKATSKTATRRFTTLVLFTAVNLAILAIIVVARTNWLRRA